MRGPSYEMSGEADETYESLEAGSQSEAYEMEMAARCSRSAARRSSRSSSGGSSVRDLGGPRLRRSAAGQALGGVLQDAARQVLPQVGQDHRQRRRRRDRRPARPARRELARPPVRARGAVRRGPRVRGRPGVRPRRRGRGRSAQRSPAWRPPAGGPRRGDGGRAPLAARPRPGADLRLRPARCAVARAAGCGRATASSSTAPEPPSIRPTRRRRAMEYEAFE